MKKQGAAQYLHLAFEQGKIYINPETDDIVVSHITPDMHARDVKNWSVSDQCKAKLYATDGYYVEVDNKLENKKKGERVNPRKEKAIEDLKDKFKTEIEMARALKETETTSEEKNQAEKTEKTSKIEPQTNSDLKKTAAETKEITAENIRTISDTHSQFEFEVLDKLQQLNENAGDNVCDTIEAISKEIKTVSEQTVREIVQTGKTASRDAGKMIVQEVKSEFTNLASRLQDDAKKNQEELLRGTKSIQKKVEELDEICEATEMIEGRLAKLDQIDTIVNILSEKGIEISRDYPPVCEEEEDIINLVRYAKKISEQLGYAARELIRKRAFYENKEQNFVNEQAVTEKKISDARNAGVAEGKLFALKALLSKYVDIDTIIDSDSAHVHAIWAFMQELDVMIDGDGKYRKGLELEFSEEEAEKLAGNYQKLGGAGRYRVVKTGLRYGGEVIFRAEFEKLINEETCAEAGESSLADVNDEQKAE